MHRQSIGSPSSRHLRISGDVAEDVKVGKAIRSSFGISSVHLIPVLTLLCFLILYISSHDPSPADLVSFSGSSLLIHSKVSNEMTGAVAAMVSNRGLKEEDPKKLRIRKLGIR